MLFFRRCHAYYARFFAYAAAAAACYAAYRYADGYAAIAFAAMPCCRDDMLTPPLMLYHITLCRQPFRAYAAILRDILLRHVLPLCCHDFRLSIVADALSKLLRCCALMFSSDNAAMRYSAS